MIKPIICTLITFVFWGSSQAQTSRELPQKALDFITLHFPKAQISRFKADAGEKEWEVRLSDGHELNFDMSGMWTEIEGEHAPIPKSVIDILPEGIRNYIAGKYPRRTIVKIENRPQTYEIELSNDVELIFDKDGKFLRKD